jgi:hypothetical protein
VDATNDARTRTSWARRLLPAALLGLAACHAVPPAAPPPADPGPPPASQTRLASARPSPSAPVSAGETTLAGVACLAPARLSLARLGAGAVLSAELGPIEGPFAVLEGHTAVLLVGGRLVEATTGATVTLARPGEAEPRVVGLARRPAGPLVLVVGRRLEVRTRQGLVPLVPLPGDGWQVTCGPGATYLHDPAARPGAVHAIDDDLRTATLLELADGVTAVCPTSDGVAVGTPGVVWRLSPGAAPSTALRLEGLRPVGLAHDPRTGTLFVSDGQQVLAVVDGVPLPLVEGLGGTLACVDEGAETALWILDPARRVLARVAPLDWLGR